MEVDALDSVVEISGLTKRWGAVDALRGLDARIGPGVTGLLGPNGAGKSTLLKVLMGLIRADRGSASVMGAEVNQAGRDVRELIGYMPEDDCHIPQLSAVEYVAFCGQLDGLSATRARQRAHLTLDYVGMDEERYRPVHTYSVGMRQRIKLAQALVGGPRLVFLDEPTSGMDPAGRARMLGLVRDLGLRGVNVLLASHLLADVEQVCREVIVMDRGKVVLTGAISDLKALADESFSVIIRGDAPRFAQCLDAAGCRVLRQNGGTFSVAGSTDSIIAAAAAADVELRGLSPAKRSLTDIFMQAVGASSDPVAPETDSGGDHDRS